MNDFRVGSLFGFEIRIDTSWLVVFFLILWTFTTAVYPLEAPGRSAGTYLAMGAVGTILFFGSILVHELSHSFVARSFGIPVTGITLFIFGGISRTGREAETPRRDFLIAIAGPLASVALAILFIFIARVGTRAGLSRPIVAVSAHMAYLNGLLAFFNLLPGFPLDGGRVLRAAAWKWTGDLTRATRIAAIGGRGLGFVVMGLGAWILLRGDLIGGLWLVFIGWFVAALAQTSWRDHLVRAALESARAREVMTVMPESVAPEATLRQLVDERFLRFRHAAFPVVEAGRAIGIVTMREVGAVPVADWDRRTAREVMLPASSVTVGSEDRLAAVLKVMEGARVQRALVAAPDGRLVGIITPGDISRWIEHARLAGEEGRSEAPRAEPRGREAFSG
jgi:Zn-dependent protease/CBS domain-containing protein